MGNDCKVAFSLHIFESISNDYNFCCCMYWQSCEVNAGT